jgi:hypothetical protein
MNRCHTRYRDAKVATKYLSSGGRFVEIRT